VLTHGSSNAGGGARVVESAVEAIMGCFGPFLLNGNTVWTARRTKIRGDIQADQSATSSFLHPGILGGGIDM
jgi:hypothetical protein